LAKLFGSNERGSIARRRHSGEVSGNKDIRKTLCASYREFADLANI
jgi:hypothetical protein